MVTVEGIRSRTSSSESKKKVRRGTKNIFRKIKVTVNTVIGLLESGYIRKFDAFYQDSVLTAQLKMKLKRMLLKKYGLDNLRRRAIRLIKNHEKPSSSVAETPEK